MMAWYELYEFGESSGEYGKSSEKFGEEVETDTKEMILYYMCTNPHITAKSIAQELGITSQAAALPYKLQIKTRRKKPCTRFQT